MRACRSLKLSFCCVSMPLGTVKLRNVAVNGFTDQRTGTDSPVAFIAIPILVVPFVQHTGPDSTEFFKGEIIEISDSSIHNEVQMFYTSFSTVLVMGSCDAEIVIYRGS